MKVPTTYSDWAILLDRFSDGDDSVLEELSNGNFTVDAGTAARFYKKVEEAYKKRKQNWLEKFQRSFELQNLKTEDDFEIALRNGKQNLSPLSRFAVLKSFPDDLKKLLRKDLEGFVSEIKTSLKSNASKLRGREKMILLLNSFELNLNSEEIKGDSKNNKQSTNEIIPPTGRKIIF
ncbi:hypothetical protein [Flavobacterium sp. ENC]|uniref:hypothetical protein n=1 Tax=Flavobacterium sp. ENC TaxID=2897330 RepID=UPI001E2CE1C9|nr:hypothetical protein [Flavobacterium sp. ENC]MCD0467792.1 hypothetical protein [Flavobacterium sp. ENC]